MDISVSRFRAQCLRLIRSVEQRKQPVDIKRRGKLVARLMPPRDEEQEGTCAWERLRGSGTLAGPAGQSVLHDNDFEANR